MSVAVVLAYLPGYGRSGSHSAPFGFSRAYAWTQKVRLCSLLALVDLFVVDSDMFLTMAVSDCYALYRILSV